MSSASDWRRVVEFDLQSWIARHITEAFRGRPVHITHAFGYDFRKERKCRDS